MPKEIQSSQPEDPNVVPLEKTRKDAEFEALLEKSSLGTPGGKALRERISPESIERVRAIMRELKGTPDATVTDISHQERGKGTKPPKK